MEKENESMQILEENMDEFFCKLGQGKAFLK